MDQELKNEFVKIHHKFEKMDKRFDTLEHHIQVVDFKINHLEKSTDEGFALAFNILAQQSYAVRYANRRVQEDVI